MEKRFYRFCLGLWIIGILCTFSFLSTSPRIFAPYVLWIIFAVLWAIGTIVVGSCNYRQCSLFALSYSIAAFWPLLFLVDTMFPGENSDSSEGPDED